MNRTVVSLSLIALALTPALVKAQVPAQYTPTAIPSLGGRESYAYKINNFGQVAGSAQKSTGLFSAIVWSNNTLKELGTLNGSGNSYAYSINDGGVVAGQSSSSTGNRAFTQRTVNNTLSLLSLGTLVGGSTSAAWGINNLGSVVGQALKSTNRAVLWSNGLTQDLGTLGGKTAYATDINDTNQISGYSQNAKSVFRAFLWSGGKMQDLGTLGGNSIGNGINSRGDVAGVSYLAGNTRRHAVLWSDGKMQDLGTLGGPNSTAYDVSDSGIVVGESDQPDGMSFATIWVNGKIVNLNTCLPAGSGWMLLSARSINSSGQIAGYGYQRGIKRGFVLTPVQ